MRLIARKSSNPTRRPVRGTVAKRRRVQGIPYLSGILIQRVDSSFGGP